MNEAVFVGELPGPLVGAGWLAEHLGADGLLVLDASVGAHRGGPRRLPGALMFDLDGEMSDATATAPHTMPAPEQFAARLRELGVNDDSTVIVYDAAGLYSAARAWWMLRAIGFDRAAVLDGGLPGWTAAGHPVQDHPAARRADRPGRLTARPGQRLFRDATEVTAALADPRHAVLDARPRGRFDGTAPEPRPGIRSGHMPGSASLPFTDLLHDGHLRPAAELRALLAAAAPGHDRLTVSCGSGVTACVLALAATLTGHPDVTVYDGSWTDWAATAAGRPVATGP